jgi:hypothetical protein
MWIPPLYYNPSIGKVFDAARGRATKLVRCEGCGRNYAYELTRTGYGQDAGSFWSFWGSYTVARQKAEADLRHRLATGIEVVPCPACGWYQSSMVPEARRRHRRWMLHVGQCLAVGLAVPALIGWSLVPWPVFVAGLVFPLALGTGLMIWRSRLARRYDPNNEDVEARKRYGQSRATLLSEQEAEDVLARTGAYDRVAGKEKDHTVWFGYALAILVLGLVGYAAVRPIIRAHVAAGFEKDLPAYVALLPVLPPNGGAQPRQLPPGRSTGKVKGKMVVVNVNERTIDDLHFALPDSLCASKPEEVATVVLLTWGKSPTSQDPFSLPLYGNRYIMIGQVKVFDWQRKSEIASVTFLGDVPDLDPYSEGKPTTGPKPDARVLSFLTGLPRE